MSSTVIVQCFIVLCFTVLLYLHTPPICGISLLSFTTGSGVSAGDGDGDGIA